MNSTMFFGVGENQGLWAIRLKKHGSWLGTHSAEQGEGGGNPARNAGTRIETGLEKSTHGGGSIGGSESGNDETGRGDGEVVHAKVERRETGLTGGGLGEVEENGRIGVLGGGDEGI